MASKSYGLNRNSPTDDGPDAITVGSLAVSSNDIELRFDLTKSLTTLDVIRACNAFIRRLETQDRGPADVANI